MTPGSNEPPPDPAPAAGTGNELRGNAGAVVQTGAVHGDVHVTAPAPPDPSVPRRLPMAVAGFVNREAELARLDTLPAPEQETPGRADAVVISAIGGAPGIGKTALALHWAHRVRARYSDGDLYLNMRGHGPGPRPDAAQALDFLLRALEVPPERIPPTWTARRPCTAPGWTASACSSSSTTPSPPSRSAPCCPHHPPAWP